MRPAYGTGLITMFRLCCLDVALLIYAVFCVCDILGARDLLDAAQATRAGHICMQSNVQIQWVSTSHPAAPDIQRGITMCRGFSLCVSASQCMRQGHAFFRRAHIGHELREAGVQARRKVPDHLQRDPVVLPRLRQLHQPLVLPHPLQQVHKGLQRGLLVRLQRAVGVNMLMGMSLCGFWCACGLNSRGRGDKARRGLRLLDLAQHKCAAPIQGAKRVRRDGAVLWLQARRRLAVCVGRPARRAKMNPSPPNASPPHLELEQAMQCLDGMQTHILGRSVPPETFPFAAGLQRQV